MITIGDTIVSARYLENGRKFNTYSSIDIPVGIEYSKRISKFEFGFSAIALVNLTFSTSGSVAEDDDSFAPISDKYRNMIGVRFRLSAPIQYYIGQRISLSIAPSVTLSPRSISDPTYSYDHRVNLFSVRLFADHSF